MKITKEQLNKINRLNENLSKLRLILADLNAKGGEGGKIGIVNIHHNAASVHTYSTTLHHFGGIEDSLTNHGINLIESEIKLIEVDLSEYIIEAVK